MGEAKFWKRSILAFLLIIGSSWAMTREQLKKTGKIMKNSCMPKHQVTEELVGKIEEGKFVESRNVMCYVACIYTRLGAVKNGKMDMGSALKVVAALYPADIREAARRAVSACAAAVSARSCEDMCESAYWSAKCMYDFDAESFIFP